MNNDSAFLREVWRRVVIYDGATGTNLQRKELTAADYGGEATEGCNEYLVITRPDVIEELHTSFFEVGVDVVETDSFTASRLKLDEYGLGELTREINMTAAQIARRVADRFSTPERPRFVAGSMGPTGMLPSSSDPVLSNITYAQLVAIFREQATALIEGGVDVLLIETSQDILEVRAAITGIHQACADLDVWRPIQAQVTLDTSGRMLLGTDIAASMAILVNLGVDVIGLNCSTGPDLMREPVRFLGENCPLPISTIPNAGLPLNVNGQAVYPMEPAAMAEALATFVSQVGVNIVGGCCGNSPEHMRAIVEAINALPVEQRERPVRRITEGYGAALYAEAVQPDPASPRRTISLPLVASGIRAASLLQEPRPLIVGERVNAQGSRKIKQAILKDDYDTLLVVARDQVEWGAHALDVQVAVTERGDEVNQMRQAVKMLAMGIEAPLCIDSTEANVIKAALETYPGRAIVNSINMENGRQRIEAVLPMVKEHGAAVVALTIDEVSMAKTADHKIAVAQRIYDIATQEYGIAPDALIFDVLTFPLTTGQEEMRTSALETLEGIRRVKAQLPGALTILGVSNASFGVQPHARAVLNSVYLYHAVAAGLDLAIVNPTHITPYDEIDAEQRKLCDDLINNTDPDALPRFISYYEEHGTPQNRAEEKADPTEGMTVDEKIHYMILHRKKDGIEALIDTAIQNRFVALGAGDGPHPLTPSPSADGEGERNEAHPLMERGLQGEERRALCRDLRERQTPAEEFMWELLRNRHFAGYKFRRQHPLGAYITDFYCPELYLVIELDGGVHRTQLARDQQRDEILQQYAIQTLRITNEELLDDPEAVCERIAATIQSISPSPSAMERGPGGEATPPIPDATRRSEAAVQTLNTVLLPAMKDVGDRFGAGTLILPFVLQSAEVMKKAVSHLEQYLERQEGYTKGRVVLATVYGDVHDIGKNLVNTILSNNGYTVYDLGKQVPLNTIIDKAVEVNADAIGLSALLVSTSKQMPLCIQELHKRGLNYPVIVGGAAINRAYGRRILWVGDEAEGTRQPYQSGVYYARDAFEGLDLMDRIVDAEKRQTLFDLTVQDAIDAEQKIAATQQRAAEAREGVALAPIVNRATATIPTPPFWGPRVLDRIAPEDVVPFLDRNALFRGRWGGKAHGAEFDALVKEDFEPRLAEMIRRMRFERTLEPRAIYGYYPCWSEGDELVILDPNDHQHEIARFAFPRQPAGERLCLTDYFAPRGSRPTPDIIAFQVVTMGSRASDQIDALQAKGEYSAAYYTHGLSVQMAEAMADYVNAQVRADLGFSDPESCRRYSWGYAAIPDLEDHAKLFALLPITESIGVTITESFQFVPEQSTAALVVHNPAATYFSVRE